MYSVIQFTPTFSEINFGHTKILDIVSIKIFCSFRNRKVTCEFFIFCIITRLDLSYQGLLPYVLCRLGDVPQTQLHLLLVINKRNYLINTCNTTIKHWNIHVNEKKIYYIY